MDERTALPKAKSETRLVDYRPSAFSISRTFITFGLFEDRAEVATVTNIERTEPGIKDLLLDGGPFMSLEQVAIDGRLLKEPEYALKSESLLLVDVPDEFELRIVTKLLPHENTRLEGLYFSGGNFCTQCEAEGFRHITYYLDRPDVLSRFDVRIEAEKSRYPVLLSNGNAGKAGELEQGRHFAEWHDPHLKPCYLFALVAGDLACNSDNFKTAGGKQVALNVFVDSRDLAKSDHAMASLKRSMKWDEEKFGLEYDLSVYNIVAISDFNMGAMENKGLNIFNTKYVLASPDTATDADFEHVEAVIGHEYFHNWTGNRVTCRDWFQLSLKEGLTVYRDQEFSADMGSRAIKRIDDVRLLRMLQFSEDAGPLAHPIRPEKYIEINNFYTATVYNKGAEVIRMIHMLLGEGAFRRGMDLYFERHDGQAVTCEDFICAMEDASGRDLQQFRLWYSQAGTPRLEFSRRRYGGKVSLTIEQSCPATPGQQDKRHFHMPVLVGWLDEEGNPIEPQCINNGIWREDGCLLELRQPRQIFEFENVPEGAVPSLLRQFSAPIIFEDDLSADELAFLMQYDGDTFARWEAAQTLASRLILAEITQAKANEAKAPYFEAFSNILGDKLADNALIAEVLALPSEIDLGRQMNCLEPAVVHRVREGVVRELAVRNKLEVLRLYKELSNEPPFSLSEVEKGRRRLRNLLLGYIVHLDEGEALAEAHFSAANNMTDRLAALALICHSDFACRETVLAEFYDKWNDDALVLDKWFAVQAASTRPDTLQVVNTLSGHKDFTIENPNRLRSLVTTFTMLNQAGFHAEGGAGYRFLAEMIVEVDTLNPQAAARMVPPLGRWNRLSSLESGQMKSSLEWIMRQRPLSSDVRELCAKMLN